jgi:high affinity sulfate transporter 1
MRSGSLTGWLPGLGLARGADRSSVGADLVAGAVLTGVLIPAGMGYAVVAGLPPVTGLFATIVGLLAYALVGPSRILVIGPDSSLAPIIGAAVVPLAGTDPDRAVALAGLLALLVGAILLVGGLLRLGFVMDLLSKPIRLGYLNGVAAVLIVDQLPKLLGFSVDADGLPASLRAFIDGVRDGDSTAWASAIGVTSLVAILVLRWGAPKVPGILVVVVGAMLAVRWLDPGGVPVVGALPHGLPAPALGGLAWGDVRSLLPAAGGIALVAFADTGVLSRVFAGSRREAPQDNREMAAVGVVNLACGALGGFPVSGSSSRTPVAQASGARSQLTGVVGAALVALLLVAAPGATTHLPSAALAAVVIAAAISLADLTGVRRLVTASGTEFALSLVAFFGVAALGVLPGIGVAVALSAVAFVAKAWRPYRAELVRVDRRKGYHDVERHPEGRRIPGLVIARFDAPLFFANAGVFSHFVRGLVDATPGPVRWVAVAAEPITDVDTTAADELVALDDYLAARGIHLVFAELKGPVKERLARLGLAERFGPERMYPTVGNAVSAYVRATGTPWVDWSEAEDG